MELIAIDWDVVLRNFSRILIAFVLTVPIAFERMRRTRSIGLRTYPIVGMASAGFILIAQSLPGVTSEGVVRALQGLIAGIGFIGGGAILKRGTDVRGLATAASFWNTGAIGAAVALDRLEIAIVLAFLNFATLFVLTPVADDIKNGSSEGEKVSSE